MEGELDPFAFFMRNSQEINHSLLRITPVEMRKDIPNRKRRIPNHCRGEFKIHFDLLFGGISFGGLETCLSIVCLKTKHIIPDLNKFEVHCLGKLERSSVDNKEDSAEPIEFNPPCIVLDF